MNPEDWKPVVLRKSVPKQPPPQKPAFHKAVENLNSDDPEPLKTVGVEIGKRIVEARLAKKLTQKELAKQTNLNVADIAAFERGTAILNRPKLNILARFLGVSLR